MVTEFIKIYAWGRLCHFSPLKEHALSYFERRKLEMWILLQEFPDLEYNNDFSLFIIPKFPMPEVIMQEYSRLLVVLPVKNDKNLDLVYPAITIDSFYLDADLQDRNGNYVMNVLRGLDFNFELFNNRMDQGYSRFLLLSNDWCPSWDIFSGDNLLTLIRKILYTISQLGR